MQDIVAEISDVDTRSASISADDCILVEVLPRRITSGSTVADTAKSAVTRSAIAPVTTEANVYVSSASEFSGIEPVTVAAKVYVSSASEFSGIEPVAVASNVYVSSAAEFSGIDPVAVASKV